MTKKQYVFHCYSLGANHPPTIKGTSSFGNLSVRVGVPPWVRSELANLARGATIQALALHRGPEYADQAVTG